jgi:oligopeptidase B
VDIADTADLVRPPIAKRVPKIDVVHGDRREDPYSWMRQKDDPEVIAHLHAENAYADAVMRPTEPSQEALYQEMLARIKEDDQSVPYRRGAWLYYSRTEKGKQYPIFCRKYRSTDAPETVTLDLNVLAEGHVFLSIGAYAVSDDGNLLAYTTDVTGFREYTLYLKDLRTGEVRPERVEHVAAVAWSADNRTFFCVTEDAAKRPYQLWRHALGEPTAQLVFEEPDQLFRVHVWRSRSLAYLLSGSRSFTSSEVLYLRADQPHGAWQVLSPREKDHEYDLDHGGDLFYIRTNGGGRRNFRLVVAPVASPGQEHWVEVVPHREEVMLDDVDVFARHHVLHEREDGLIKLRVTDLVTGTSHHVQFPEDTYEVTAETNAEFDTATYRFRYQSLVTPASTFDYDMTTRTLELRKQTEVLGGYDRTQYRSERLHATAPDGTRVPISLVCRADTPRDGSSPMLLAGYGAYGLPYPVTFSSNRLSLLDRGVTFAIAHVRGGGELGKRWHDDGRMMNKCNTFTDFIAVADSLIANGYTASDRLVIEGGSAGGLLMGVVLNMRPDLFHAAILRVPFVDVINTMLDESLPLTVGEFEEWGNPKIQDHYEYMTRYCPYTNVSAQTYPVILVRTGLNDSQVMYWEPAKYVAKLRATRKDDRLLLFKIDMTSGHGGPSGRYDYLREIAFDYAFTLWQLDRWQGGAVPSDPRT